MITPYLSVIIPELLRQYIGKYAVNINFPIYGKYLYVNMW